MFDTIISYIASNMSDKQVGIQIKKARTDKGMSQEQLGDKLGVTWEMISRYENGRSSARKYLTQLSEILEKPISYFFGVEDDLIEYNVDKIASALREKGVGYDTVSANKILLIDDFSILGFEKSIKLTRQYYTAPEWIIEKYSDVFALRLNSVSSENIEINQGDVGFLSPSIKPESKDVVLVQQGNEYKLEKNSVSSSSAGHKGQVLAVLIAQEKRFK
ncbi:MAG: Transcriptional regulator [candidate division WS6 bacterium GW2011_GWA2_37_6]|uniref:Transcriptional regulator n=1 Tax=candidate division WS6 bacterium GW2011_GWA2_37_6 TaxID=1619087 RepID=A0A0G0HCH5_9BACT|nr:MAG: Transcriptional regulator [candidate division WS6 bacterium GW2011_GWA2_37_6]